MSVTFASLPPAVTVLAGARDGFHLPVALAEADLLDALVTEMYWPADQEWFRSSVGRMVSGRLISARFQSGLPSGRVCIDKKALIISIAGRIMPGLRRDGRLDRTLSRRARIEAFKRSSPLIAYSYYAYESFLPGRFRPSERFLFQVHPHPATVRRILRTELERTPLGRESIMAEPDIRLSDSLFKRLCEEPRLANGWMTASTYTARTLSENGIKHDNIHVVPYGVDHTRFIARLHAPSRRRPLNVIFIGSMIQRKGITDLFDAVRLLRTSQLRLVLCGRGSIDRDLLAAYQDLDIEILIGLPYEKLVQVMHQSDVFVLPSLAEGFGHVILEAMATGLPVITTDHTAGPDLIRQGEEGFIVPIRSPEAIAEKLTWCLEHRDELAAMGQAATGRAQLFTWDRFHAGIVRAYRAMYARQHFGALSCTGPTWDEPADASITENAL